MRFITVCPILSPRLPDAFLSFKKLSAHSLFYPSGCPADGVHLRVHAIDRDKYFIEKLSDETKGTNVESIEGDMTKLDQLTEHSADLIYVSTVIHALPKQKLIPFLKEAKRVLKPNALLAIVEIEKKETPFGPAMENRYSPEELMQKVPMVPVKTVMVGEHFYMQVFMNVEN
ncbi:class I SAM-dependent methyltransferase [uncultured Desulfosarcina sp.]|uniref:class I SAM-dependent methyltransferase n=1 Tax=uncultured Desulfosarcina sp. TaxID=218289 RepID=UPI0029C933E3|nr:class I SAM-dependent methyltransferase [uncultured Desulfosarcina sp.]